MVNNHRPLFLSIPKLLLLWLLLAVSFAGITAQESSFRMNPEVTLGDTSQSHLLILLDYSKLLGLAEDIEGDKLFFRLHGAEELSEFKLSEIRYLGVYNEEGKETSGFGTDGPAFTDFTYLRTALPTEGKGRVRLFNFLYGVAEFNLNDNIQLGAGLLVPAGPLFTQRIRFSVGKYLHLGVSNQATLIIVDPFEGPFLVGDARLVATYGTSERLLNFGIGKFYDTSFGDNVNTISIGGGGKIGRSWHLYGEMSIYQDDFGTTSVIPAFSASTGKARHRWRFGLATVVVNDGFIIPLPFLGYDYHW